MYALFSVWTFVPNHVSVIFTAWIWLFIFMFISHYFAVIYPLGKLRKFFVAATRDDFDDPSDRINSRSVSKSIGSSRFEFSLNDKRREFLSILDSPSMFKSLSLCANQHLCSPFILFLEEYQALKRRVMEEFATNIDLASYYREHLIPVTRNDQSAGHPNIHVFGKRDQNHSYNSISSPNNLRGSPQYLKSSLVSFNSSVSSINKDHFGILIDTSPLSDENSEGKKRFRSNSHNSNRKINSNILINPAKYFDRRGLNPDPTSHPNHLSPSTESKRSTDPSTTNKYIQLDLIKNRILINTPISVSISEAVQMMYPSSEVFPSTPVPHELRQLFISFFNVFVDPDSELVVDIHMSIVDEITQLIHNDEISLGIFDDAREEVLELLYFGVFPRYLQENKSKAKVVLTPGNFLTRAYKRFLIKRRLNKLSGK
ncbi:hypothetical protein AYI68_g1490 [Smittium mucronatum]|uniref:RGS domain-containing protein n=1 Tax=Smittium mucronatum TaxID=133383 RepID=A0A1R0H590_9FUNG|nr:hypothetical protein AYI68_g1490 [Smittium mucronatum]